MNLKFEDRNKLSYTFLRVVTGISEIDDRTRRYGTDQPLHNAEIHMIKAIKQNEGIHVTGLADILGVTKGAVSQIIQKLERKGMIVKEIDPQNQSRLILRLGPKGETAYLFHEELHRSFDELLNSALKDASEEEKAFLRSFLNSLDEKLDTFEKAEVAAQAE